MKTLVWIGGILLGIVIVGIPIAVVGSLVASIFTKRKKDVQTNKITPDDKVK